jgi:hypothetical protein
MAFQELINAACNSVIYSPRGDLSLGWRLRCWNYIIHSFPHDWRYRKAALAYSVARSTLQAWTQVQPSILSNTIIQEWPDNPIKHELPRLPYDLLVNCHLYLNQQLSEDKFNLMLRSAWTGIDALSQLSYDLGMGVYVPHVIWAACECAMDSDEELYDANDWYSNIDTESGYSQLTDESFPSPGDWDVYCIASAIASDGFLWEKQSSASKRRQYYLDILTHSFPLLVEDHNALAQLLRPSIT